MLTENRFLKFQGFQPSDFTHSYLSDRMDAIHDESPYGSTLKAIFTRKDKLFKGMVTIYSSAGKFFAVASGHRLHDVTHKLTERIRRQLDRWKSRRFDRESLRHFSINNKEENHDRNSVA